MLKLICIENDVAWVESEEGETIGIVNAFETLDEDGLKYGDESASDVLDRYTDVEQDFDNESNIIYLNDENGEYKLRIDCHGIELIELTEQSTKYLQKNRGVNL